MTLLEFRGRPRPAAPLPARFEPDSPDEWFQPASWAGYFLGAIGAVLIGIRQVFTVPGSFGMGIGAFLLICAAVLWTMTVVSGHSRPIGARPLVVALLFYLFTSLISYANGCRDFLSAFSLEYTDRTMVSDIYLVVAMCFILAAVRTRADLELALRGMVLGGTLSALFGLIQFGTGVDLAAQFRLPGLKYSDFVLVKDLERGGVSRPQGSSGHPLELSSVLTVLTPIAIGLVYSARARAVRSWPMIVCSLILIAGTVVTVSRSAIVGLIAALVVMCWRWPIGRLAALVLGAVTVAVAGTVAQLKVVSALIEIIANSKGDSSIGSRLNGQTYVVEHYREHLWFGQGVGTYPTLDQPVLDNQYLGRLMETGVLGLIGFILLLVTALILAVRGSTSADVATAELAGSIAGAIAALITISLILDSQGFPQFWQMCWILFGLAGVVYRTRRIQGAGRARGSRISNAR